MSHVRQAMSGVLVGVTLIASGAGCAIQPVQLTGSDHPTAASSQSASQPRQSSSPSFAGTDGPTLSGSAENRSCADLTFSSEFRRLFKHEAKFIPPKREKVSGQGDRVLCRISPGDGPSSSLGYAQFQYVSDSKSGCDKEGLRPDPADPAGWYGEDGTGLRYALCTKLGYAAVLYHQGTEGRAANLATVSRLAHLVVDGSWEIDKVLGP